MGKKDFKIYKNGSIFRTTDKHLTNYDKAGATGLYRSVVKIGNTSKGIKVVKLQGIKKEDLADIEKNKKRNGKFLYLFGSRRKKSKVNLEVYDKTYFGEALNHKHGKFIDDNTSIEQIDFENIQYHLNYSNFNDNSKKSKNKKKANEKMKKIQKNIIRKNYAIRSNKKKK